MCLRQTDRQKLERRRKSETESMLENVHKISVTVTFSSSLPFTNLNHLEKKKRRKKEGEERKKKRRRKTVFLFYF